MPVRAEQHIGFLHVLFALRAHGIAGNPRIDVEGLPFRSLDAEGGMAKPREADSLKIHKALLGNLRTSILVTGGKARNERAQSSERIGLNLNHFGRTQTRV